MSYTLEVCVDSFVSALNAKNGGADRLELCQDLIIGGTSPSSELFSFIKEKIDIKINVLLRPRFGDFLYDEYEFEILKKEVKLFEKLGADGVVIGILKSDGFLDIERMKILIDLAKKMDVTLHRCFDVCKDPFQTLDECEKLGVKTILTSGQKNNSIDGIALLKKLDEATSKTEIMVGSGVSSKTIEMLIDNTNIKSFHMSGKKIVNSKMIYRNPDVSMGIDAMSEYEIFETDEEEIKKVKKIFLTR